MSGKLLKFIASLLLPTLWHSQSLALETPPAAELAAYGPRFIGNTLKNCNHLKKTNASIAKMQVRYDQHGRPSAIATGNGIEHVIQYSSDTDRTPISVTGPGVNAITSHSIPPKAEMDKYLKERLKLYRLVKNVCGQEASTNRVATFSGHIQTEPGVLVENGGGYPAEYDDPAFWGGVWEPMISDYGMGEISKLPPDWEEVRKRCSERCNNGCDLGADAASVGCAAASFASLGLTPVAAASVLTACAAGVFVGKYYCKWNTCPNNCGG